MTAFYDFFKKIVLQPDNVTLEADNVGDTLTITADNGVAFIGDASTDSFTIDVNYQLYVPLGTTAIRLQDVHSNSTGITIRGGQNVNVSRGSDNEIVISSISGGISEDIINATQTSPVVITTSTNHDFTSAVFLNIELVSGMTELNNNSYYIDILSPNSFALYNDGGLTDPLDGTGFSAYSGPSGAATAYFFTTGTYYTDTRESAIRADIEPILATAVQPGDLFTGDLKGSVFGDDSTLLVDGVNSLIPASVVQGTFTGNVIGDVQGNVTGDVQGNVTGNLLGDVQGSVFGDDSTLLVDGVNSILSTSRLSQEGASDGQILTWSNISNSWIPGASNTFDSEFSSLLSIPTTVSGYGITDAYSYVDINNTNGLSTTYYLTFVDNLSTGQILRADFDLQYKTDTNTLTASVFEGNLVGDVQGSLFGDDSTLLVDGVNSLIPAEVVQGTFTGNVIGDVQGNITGDVTGNLLGNVTGDVLGNLTGNTTGIHTGPMIGNVLGDLKGSVFGDDSTLLVDGVNSLIPAEVVQGTFTGNVIGNLTGNTTGIHTGPVIGTFVGDLQGSVFGDDSTLLVDGVNSLLVGTFVGQLDVINPTITGEITSSDSSAIVVVPGVEMRSDLNVDNGIFIQNVPVATEQYVLNALAAAALVDAEKPNTVLSITDILDDFLITARAIWLVDDGIASTADNLYADGAAQTAETNANSYTDTEITNLIDGAPNDLNTLDKLAFAINYDPLFYQTVAGGGGSGATLSSFSVSSATASAGASLSYDNTTGVFTFAPADLSSFLTGSSSIDVLSDVDTTSATPTSGQALVWNGTNWVPGTVAAAGGTGATTFIELTDTPTAFTGNADYFVKVNSGGTALVFDANPGYLSSSSSIDDLDDVDTSSATPTSGQGLVWNGSSWVPSTIPSLSSFSVTTGSASSGGSLSYAAGVFTFAPADLSSAATLSSFSVTAGAASNGGSLSYDNTTGVFTFAPADLSGATSLSSFSVTTGTASGGGSLSYDNTTGAFTFAPSATSLSSFSVSPATASNGGSLTYDDTSGVFTFAPADLSGATSLSSFSVSSGTASAGGSLSYNNSTGVFSFAPADVSTFTTLSSFSVTTGTASGGGSLAYNNSTGVFSFAPAELGAFEFAGTNITTNDSSAITVTPLTTFSSDVISEGEFRGRINWNYVFNRPTLLTDYGIIAGDPLLSSVALTASANLTSAIATLAQQITDGDDAVIALIPEDLSDLTDTTGLLFDEANVDTDLLPEPTATHSLGSLTKRWLKVWTNELSIGQKSITVSGTAPNEIIDVPANTTLGGNQIATLSDLLALDDFSVSTGSASAGGSLSYDNTTGVFTFAPADLSTFTTLSSFNVSTGSASGGGSLSYNNATGAFTFTPAATIALTNLSVTQNTASGTGALAYNNSTGVFSYTPPNLSSFATLSSFSVTSATASGSGSLVYDNATGAFTFTPPALGNYVTTDTTQNITGAKTFTTNNLRMNDNIELEIGSSADMEIYHSGTDNFIDLNVGNLLIRDTTTSRFSFARTTGDFIATGDVTAFGTVSDIRQKENIVKIDSALEKVMQLNGYTFNYIGNDTRLTGVMAQEVLEVLPEAVYTTKKLDSDEEIYAVRHGNMVGLLIETIKELNQKIADLEKRLS